MPCQRAIFGIVLAAGLLLAGGTPSRASEPSANKPPSGTSRPLLVLAGASGRTGREILKAAAQAGWRVRALTSDTARARRELGRLYRSGEWRQVDLTDAAAAQSVVRGADYVVSAIGAHAFKGQDTPERVDYLASSRLIDAAAAVRVRHYVMISSGMAGTHADQTKADMLMHVRFWKTRAEEQLRSSGLTYTIVGPGGLTADPPRKLGLRILPREQYQSTDVSRADVARVVLHALQSPDAANKSFALINDRNTTIEKWREQLPQHPADRPSADLALAQLSWLAGSWRHESDKGTVNEESWLAPSGGMMLGLNRLVAKGKRAWFEFARIETRPDGSLVFVAQPGGQPPTDFIMTSMTASRISFHNRGHDFPQGVHYFLQDGELRARVDGLDDGRIASVNYRWQRAAAP